MRMATIAAVALGLMTMTAAMLHAQDREVERAAKTAAFMRLKLVHSQMILEGITLEDYEKISKGAQELILLSHESNWNVVQSPAYNEHSVDFRRAANSLLKHAREKKVDAAALDYMVLTANCVQCHKYLREERKAPAK